MSTTAYTPPDAPFVATSDTSVAAAHAIEHKKETLQSMVFNFIRQRRYDGATRPEICEALALSGDTVRPRVAELIAANRIAEATDRTRKTRHGREAAILIALVTEHNEVVE